MISVFFYSFFFMGYPMYLGCRHVGQLPFMAFHRLIDEAVLVASFQFLSEYVSK